MNKRLTVAEINEAQQICLERGIPFFLYRLPGGCWSFGAQISGEVDRSCDPADFFDKAGFMLSPFHVTHASPLRFIRQEIDLSQSGDMARLKAVPKRNLSYPLPVGSVGKDVYMQQARHLITILESGKVRKAVLSRVKTVFCNPYESVAEWFVALSEAYPESFVFLVSIPGETLWMGASPETFLKCSDTQISTMSLAGTKQKDDCSAWEEKEREEQQIVTEYIESCFMYIIGIKPEICGPESRRAGNVLHLCTTFALDKKQLSNVEISRLIRMLHPTPAVGGFPLQEALTTIREIEGRDRRYYAGYLGPVYGNGQFDLFVNLRSMELFKDRAELYVGGGLTALSDAEAEWDETEMKSRTLLDLIEIR